MPVWRGAYLGAVGLPTWILGGDGGVSLGLLDGLLFSLSGVAVAFALMFALWIFGVAGGGDLKLYAAIGAWLGPWNILPVLGIAGACVALVTIAGMAAALLRGKPAEPAGAAEKPAKSRLATFAWPLTAGTLLVLAFLLSNDFLPVQGAQPHPNQEQNHAR